MKKIYSFIIGIVFVHFATFAPAQIADLGVVGINSPLSPMCASKPSLVVTLFNYSTVNHIFSIDRANIFVNVTGASTQTFSLSVNSGTLTAGTANQYIVANPIDLTVAGTHYLDATVTIVTGDADTTNNRLPLLDIIVNPLPVITLDSLSPVCLNTPLFSLTAGNPIGGTYSGLGVSSGMFDPVAAGSGVKNITYTYTDTNGCTAFKNRYITVNIPPSVSHSSLAPVCTSATAFTLSGGTPVGGVYNGTGVSGGMFDPSTSGIGTFTLDYVYIDGNGCSDTAFIPQTVYAAPPVVFSTLNSVCINGSAVSLTSGSPLGGSYSGNGVTGGSFDPSLTGVGTFSLTYVYTDGTGCTDSAMQTITVGALPVVSHSALSDVCENSGTIILTGGTPAGGIYSGIGAADSSFTPSVPGPGTFTLTYIYSDSIGCTDSTPVAITVNSPPVVTLGTFPAVCVSGAAFALSGGSPAGGTYFGGAVSSGTFTPSVAGPGLDSIYYTYTDPSSTCSDTALSTINVIPYPSQNIGDTTHCGGTPLVLNAGNPGAGYLWSTGSTDQSITLTGTDTVNVTVSYGSGCIATFTSIATFLAPPSPYLGENIEGCENSTVVLSACAGGWSAYTWCNGGGTLCSITALNSGTYCVTVTDANGCTGSDSIDVILHPLPTVSLSLSTTFICLNDPSITLNGGTPSGGVYSGNGVSSGIFNPVSAGAGTHLITYTYTDTNGCANYATQMITVGCVGIADVISSNAPIRIFPNPANQTISILQETDVTDQLITIMDVQGKKVVEEFKNNVNKGEEITINTADMADGVYLIRLVTSQSSVVKKIVVQH